MSKGRKRKGDTELLLALACGASVENAAQRAGLSRRTVFRRLAAPAFRAQVAEARAEMVRRAAGMFTAAGLPAISGQMCGHAVPSPRMPQDRQTSAG